MSKLRLTESGNDVFTVKVTEEFHIAKARIASKLLARSIEFGDVEVYSIATSVSELANNLFFHTPKGRNDNHDRHRARW